MNIHTKITYIHITESHIKKLSLLKQSKNIVTKSNNTSNKETENNYLHTHDVNKTKRNLYSNILENNMVQTQAGKQLSNKTNIRKSQLII